ncbi:MAG: tetratricopeptide repeat protein [Verrucomicrobiota bacterium JB022]|nr:tetratricopeptide repeat protein [Verrucomicrobiota bacterium JB022]
MSSQPPHSQKPQKIDPALDPNRELPPDADVDEHFINFWKKQGPAFAFFFIVLGLGLIGIQTWNYLQARGEEKAKAAYQEALAAEDPAALLSFADAHAKSELGGLAYLNIAQREFEQADYTQAAAHYQKAVDALGDSAFGQRARMSLAVTQLRNGNQAQGLAGLEDLAFDPNALEAVRAEAAIYLAGERWSQNNIKGARQMLLMVQQLPEARLWQGAAQGMLDQLPADTASGETANEAIELPGGL